MKLKQVDEMPESGEFIAAWVNSNGGLMSEVFWISDEGIKDDDAVKIIDHLTKVFDIRRG